MKPVLQALLLADHIYEDRTTGKKVIAGTFNCLLYQEVTVTAAENDHGEDVAVIRGGRQAGSPWAYINLTDVQGTVPLELRYVDLENNHVLMGTELSVTASDRLATTELAIPLPQLPRPHPGVYALELLCDNEPMGALRITVLKRDEGTT